MATTQQDVKMLKDEIAKLKSVVAEQAKQAQSNGVDQAQQTKESMRTAAKEAGRTARAFISDAQTQAVDAKDACEGTIKKHPFKSAAVAFAGGALLGALLRRS